MVLSLMLFFIFPFLDKERSGLALRPSLLSFILRDCMGPTSRILYQSKYLCINGEEGMKDYTLRRGYNEQGRLFTASDINEELETEEIKRAEDEEAALINDIFSGSNCYYTGPSNQTTFTMKTSTALPANGKSTYKILRFTERIDKRHCTHHVLGNMAFIDNPYHTLSILEPNSPGTCNGSLFRAPLVPVQQTVTGHRPKCRLSTNAGFLNRLTGNCFGNIVSNGRIVQSAGSIQDANVGIKEDGTIMVGYISDDEVFNETNPFRFLLTGVIWLVRNGTNNVNKSMYIECSHNSRGISINNCVRITSARAAIGHDDRGRVVLARVEGKSLVRGTGKRTPLGAIKDGYNSAIRYYYNNFADGFRHLPLAFLLGLSMLLICLIVPSTNPFSQTLYLIFWGLLIVACCFILYKNGPHFVDSPKLVQTEDKKTV